MEEAVKFHVDQNLRDCSLEYSKTVVVRCTGGIKLLSKVYCGQFVGNFEYLCGGVGKVRW